MAPVNGQRRHPPGQRCNEPPVSRVVQWKDDRPSNNTPHNMTTMALLALFTLACLALGAQRTWNDDTQVERNALVFQGRNQAYGAFRLRQDYHHRLLVAIIATFGLLALAVAFAIVLRGEAPPAPPPTASNMVDVDLERIYVQHTNPKPGPANSPLLPTPTSKARTERPLEAVDSLVAAKPLPLDTAPFTPAPGGSGTTGTAGAAGGQLGDTAGNGMATGIDTVWSGPEVQEMPAFPGGEAALQAWMQDHLDLPAGAVVREMVFVQFTVMRDGTLQNVQAVKGSNAALKLAAERAVKRMPPWIPGRMNGNTVRCRLTLPIRYETR